MPPRRHLERDRAGVRLRDAIGVFANERLRPNPGCLPLWTLTPLAAVPTVAPMRTLLEMLGVAADAVTAFWTFVP